MLTIHDPNKNPEYLPKPKEEHWAIVSFKSNSAVIVALVIVVIVLILK